MTNSERMIDEAALQHADRVRCASLDKERWPSTREIIEAYVATSSASNQNRLARAISSLFGYCQSAIALDETSTLQEWVEGLIERANVLDAAWEEVCHGGGVDD